MLLRLSQKVNKEQLPFLRGLLLCFGLILVVAMHCLEFPWFYDSRYISQEIFILIFLHFLLFWFWLEPNENRIALGLGQGILLGGSLFVLLTNWSNPLGVAVLILYVLLFLLIVHCRNINSLPLAIAFGAVCSAILGLYQYVAIQVGVLEPLPTTRLAGTYGQPNLTAALMLLGLFCYYHVLFTAGKFRFHYHIPGLLMAVVLFLTGSRAGMLALAISVVFALYILMKYRLKKGVLTLNLYLLGVLSLGYWFSNFFSKVTPLQRNVSELAVASGSVNSYQRFNDWFSSLWMGYDHLIVGVGIGNFKNHLSEYQIKTVDFLKFTYDSISQTLWAHNDFLHIFAENGIFVFICFLILCMYIFVRIINKKEFDKYFICLGFFSFLIMMMFGHPFRYHALVFSFVLISAILIENENSVFFVSKNVFFAFLLSSIVFVDCLFIPHFFKMASLREAQFEYAKSTPLDLSHYRYIEKKYLNNAIDDRLYGYLFQHELYSRVVSDVFFSQDRELGSYILPGLLKYSEKNKFPIIAYDIARVYYSLGEYEKAKAFSQGALQKKPDENKYFDLLHLSNVMLISQKNNIPLKKLISSEHFEKLMENNVIHSSQIGVDGVALR